MKYLRYFTGVCFQPSTVHVADFTILLTLMSFPDCLKLVLKGNLLFREELEKKGFIVKKMIVLN